MRGNVTTRKPLLTATEKHAKWDMVGALSKTRTHYGSRSGFPNYNLTNMSLYSDTLS